jgi:hypothetical protein
LRILKKKSEEFEFGLKKKIVSQGSLSLDGQILS